MEENEVTDEFQETRDWEEMVATRGWRMRLVPILAARKHAMERHFRNPSEERKSKIPDDYIRGQLDVMELILEHPHMLIETARNSQVEERLAALREEKYSQQASLGYGTGFVPGDPADEFV